ncbi:MAG: hypothetical protein C00003105_00803 [ANME-2 cluster archaeon HR1]|nr:MAG: hypothetical protein C00003105_00803 [ANME-2 cluster archaeon HR1]
MDVSQERVVEDILLILTTNNHDILSLLIILLNGIVPLCSIRFKYVNRVSGPGGIVVALSRPRSGLFVAFWLNPIVTISTLSVAVMSIVHSSDARAVEKFRKTNNIAISISITIDLICVTPFMI